MIDPSTVDSQQSTTSYRRIFWSTAIIGGASALDIFFRMVRAKYIAVTLGAEGTGLFGMYNSVIMTAAGLVGLGLGSTAVREIAAAQAENSQKD